MSDRRVRPARALEWARSACVSGAERVCASGAPVRVRERSGAPARGRVRGRRERVCASGAGACGCAWAERSALARAERAPVGVRGRSAFARAERVCVGGGGAERVCASGAERLWVCVGEARACAWAERGRLRVRSACVRGRSGSVCVSGARVRTGACLREPDALTQTQTRPRAPVSPVRADARGVAIPGPPARRRTGQRMAADGLIRKCGWMSSGTSSRSASFSRTAAETMPLRAMRRPAPS